MKERVRRAIAQWICIAGIAFPLAFFATLKPAKADIWGGDVVVLTQILVETITQVAQIVKILEETKQTVALLQEMNQGVKEVLRLADTAHIPLPPQVYDAAKTIDAAALIAQGQYGVLPDRALSKDRNEFQNGAEGLFISRDAFDYSNFLDDKGERIKQAAVISSQATATRLTAESLGVLVHAVSHSNRIQAKSLQLQSTQRLEDSERSASQFENFLNTQSALRSEMNTQGFTPLNSFFNEGGAK